MLGTYRATARVDDRFVVPPGENEGCLNAKKPAEGYQDGASTPNAIVVSADAQSNVISVVYARRTDLDYVIHHCEWGTGRQLAQSTARKGTFGEEILAEDPAMSTIAAIRLPGSFWAAGLIPLRFTTPPKRC